jgi:hypothetical protein
VTRLYILHILEFETESCPYSRLPVDSRRDLEPILLRLSQQVVASNGRRWALFSTFSPDFLALGRPCWEHGWIHWQRALLKVLILEGLFGSNPPLGVVGQKLVEQVEPALRQIRKPLPQVVERSLCECDFLCYRELVVARPNLLAWGSQLL